MISYPSVELTDPRVTEERRKLDSFESDLKVLINSYSRENYSNTPDWILAQYMHNCLKVWELTTGLREGYYGRVPEPVPTDQCPTEPPK